MPGVLDIKRATVYRGETRVFEELSLDIAVGEHTAILGPNGAGKSTLLKLLSRELSPVPREDGYVRLFGREQWDVWDLRARLGIVSHDLHHRYSDEVRGTDVVLSGYYASVGTYDHQRFTPAQRHRADHVMDELGVTSHKDRMFAELSAGEQRRFLLGRALVHDPGVLILDEPTGGLDLNACFRYLEIVRRLIRDGKTIILVTHHIHEIPP
ncbi:MAG: ATP-binding cassette domain-containing protein, partial [Nitrospirota bacterium]|nr:ATP-binding cassette domain-containing protein [Nitrospirota bacterium]